MIDDDAYFAAFESLQLEIFKSNAAGSFIPMIKTFVSVQHKARRAESYL